MIARYVMPEFQGSLLNLRASQSAAKDSIPEIKSLQADAIEKARREYAQRQS